MQKRKKAIAVVFLALIVIMVAKIISNTQYKECTIIASEERMPAVYYLLNIDGMKGLGHSSLLLVDSQGKGYLYSYNGMQYSLAECLMGKAGIGKMTFFELEPECVNEFLETGDLEVAVESECDNYDRALYTYISNEECEAIKEELAYYIEVGDKYQQLYADAYILQSEESTVAEAALQEYVSSENIPKYQIYNHNCDAVAREAIATVSDEMQEYNASEEKLFPSSNYKNMCEQFGTEWGTIHLGQDTFVEKILWYLF